MSTPAGGIAREEEDGGWKRVMSENGVRLIMLLDNGNVFKNLANLKQVITDTCNLLFC